MNKIKTLFLLPIVLLTLASPGSMNWCADSWFKLFIFYCIYFIGAIYISYSKRLNLKIRNSLSVLYIFLCLMFAIFPGTLFADYAFNYACPNGSYWGDSDLSWPNLFQYGLLSFIDRQSQAVMFSGLMLAYIGFFIVTIFTDHKLKSN